MAYCLSSNLSFCLLAGDPYFLDVRRNRYFRLDGVLRAAFLSLVENASDADAKADPLLEQGIIEWTQGASRISPASVDIPAHSLMEEAEVAKGGGVGLIFEAAWLLSKARLERRRVPFAMMVEHHRKRLRRLKEGGASENVFPLARRFVAARRAIPAAPECLPDSMALLEFLNRREMRAQMVIGVRRDPFAAHCWVQAAGVLLNERVDVACGFTPIYAIP